MHHIIILVVCVILLSASFLFKVGEDCLYIFGLKWPLHCSLYQRFGIKCALCCLSRSFASMAHGNLYKSYQFHKIGPALFAFVILQIPYRIYSILTNPKKMNKNIIKINNTFAILVITAIFINWLSYLGGFIL